MSSNCWTWVFDLDDTLHNASANIFPHIHKAMSQYLVQNLGLSEADANQLRRIYWMRYGATLKGLMRHHAVNPHHFLSHTHPTGELESMVKHSKGLNCILNKLPGRKYIFTNAPKQYALKILKILKISHHFDGIFSIESSGFRPKPELAGFRRFFRKFNLDPHRCIMVEDSLSALKTANRLGMRTVFVNPDANRPNYVDSYIRSILLLPKLIGSIS